MSWGGGVDIMSDAITSFNKHKIPAPLRRKLYLDLIESLQSMDWGNANECQGVDPAYDGALETVYRRWCDSHGHDYDAFFGDRS